MRQLVNVLLISLFSLTIISCSSEDDSALKDGKVAANLSEADSLDSPNISLISINDSVEATNQTSVSVKLTGADAVGITGYIISNQSTVPDLNSSNWVDITSQTQYSVTKDSTVGPSDASYSFYGWMRDKPGGISATATSSIYYDSTAPTISSVSINSGDSSSTNTVVNLTISASDSLSGITAYYASETSTAPSATATGWIDITKTNSLSTTKSYTLSSPGQVGTFTKTVYLWVKDSAGNVSDSASDSIQLILTDQSAPTNPSISINSGASSTASSSVTLSLSATDDIGVTGYYLSQTPGISTPSSSASGWTSVTSATSFSASVSYTLSGGNGTNTVYVWFKDGAGNVSSSASDSITLQDDPPSNPSISINSGATSTGSSTVTLTISASDDVGITGYHISETWDFTASEKPPSSSNIWTTVYSTTSYSASVSFDLTGGSGTKTVYVWFKDSAGNVSSAVSDSITYLFIPNIYCGNTNTSSGGTTAFIGTKITNNSVYNVTLSSGEHSYYFFTATSGNSYTISYSSTSGVFFKVYKGVGNRFAYEYGTCESKTISSYSGNVIIYFEQNVSTPTVTFQVTGTISNLHTTKNSYCQQSITKGSSAYSTTSVELDKIHSISLSSGESAYFSFTANSSSTYNISYSSTKGVFFKVYKGVGNQYAYEYDHDEATTVSSYSGVVIIYFEQNVSTPTVDFMIHEE